MPKLIIERSVVIQAPVETVYEMVRDFKRWPEWSPWLITEREAALSFTEDGKSYAWDGKLIGSGSMERINEDANESLQMHLTMLTPWKSESDVRFNFEAVDGGTRVTWRMDGSLPWFLFFLKSMMTNLIGMDYDRGLGMLKDLSEIGTVPSLVEPCPGQSHAGCHYVGIVRYCSVAEMPDFMGEDFKKLKAYFEANDLKPSECPFTIYSKWNLSKAMVEYTACFPIEVKPDSLPNEYVFRELPQVDAYVVTHTGAYRHLGNAWSAGMCRGRQKVFKQSKKVFPFEVYVTEIDSVPDAEIVTKVYFPTC